MPFSSARKNGEIPASESEGFGLHALIGFELLRTRSQKAALTLHVRIFSGVPDEDDDHNDDDPNDDGDEEEH